MSFQSLFVVQTISLHEHSCWLSFWPWLSTVADCMSGPRQAIQVRPRARNGCRSIMHSRAGGILDPYVKAPKKERICMHVCRVEKRMLAYACCSYCQSHRSSRLTLTLSWSSCTTLLLYTDSAEMADSYDFFSDSISISTQKLLVIFDHIRSWCFPPGARHNHDRLIGLPKHHPLTPYPVYPTIFLMSRLRCRIAIPRGGNKSVS